MAVHHVPGGGKNNRRAARLEACKQATTWVACPFECLNIGDVVILFEEDNTPVAYTDGCLTAVVMSAPCQDAEGIWGFTSCTCLELANIKIPAKDG